MIKENNIGIRIYENNLEGSQKFAQKFVDNINLVLKKKKKCVISIPTGNSPINFYQSLINLYKEKKISFKNVIFFNLDEFFPISKHHRESYYYYLQTKLFNHIDLPRNNINLLEGDIKEKSLKKYCESFEKNIKKLGGLDIQILGIGRNGHIGFNEPGSNINSITRKVRISNDSLNIISKDFSNKTRIPKEALTLGINTILSAKKIYLLAWGLEKASIIKNTLKGKVNSDIPSTYLQNHNNVSFILDKDAASKILISD